MVEHDHSLHRHGDGAPHLDCICGRELVVSHDGPAVCECRRKWRRIPGPIIVRRGPLLDPVRVGRFVPYREGGDQ